MSEQETIEYWTHKIEEQAEWLEKHRQKEEERIRENNKTSKIYVDPSIARIIPKELYENAQIPVHDFEILQKNNIQLEHSWWSCVSGSKEYQERCKMTFFENSHSHVASGTPIVGYYKIIRIEDNEVVCYYNSASADEFVTQEVNINRHRLFAPYSEGNRNYLCEGDVLHVESLQLINKRYAVKWQIL